MISFLYRDRWRRGLLQGALRVACAARRCGAGRSDDGIERWGEEEGAGAVGQN